ncbi:MAG TPA: hypothetical protein VEL71_02175 [Candidatus Dormibacteraeota bacterium]|nr:hypothetical protein [Candidatus Dormibacteraeota bacterium]
MSIDFSRIIPRTFSIRLVRVLKSLRKPFALWPFIAAFARPFRTVARHGSGRVQLAPKLKRPLPAWSLVIMLLLGAGVGFYASTIFSEVAGIGQSTAPDFTLGTNPVAMITSQGGLAAFTVSLTSLNSFAGSVNLNYSLSPGITNVTIALNPSSLSLLTGAGASTMTVSGPASAPLNTYTITIGGTSGRLSHNVTSILRVVPPPSPDFSISAAPSSINVTRGSSTSSTITLTSIGGFAGTVNLSASISPSSGSSPTLALNPNRVTLLSGGTGNSVLTISTTGTTLLGVYTIVVLGVSGTLANSVSITLRVQ